MLLSIPVTFMNSLDNSSHIVSNPMYMTVNALAVALTSVKLKVLELAHRALAYPALSP